ncbi:ADP-ribosylglycohydrolase family protein, partial [Clostridium botulinum]|nr:ADP-ribosylglycohydrolase family protein [Clostridium botulinum]
MIGSIIGDIVGSSYELINTNKKDFNLYRKISRFTDDTVLTI